MKNKLISYLPYYYHDITEMIKLQEAIEYEYSSLIKKIEDLFNQIYIFKATWGLTLWEKMLDLEIGDFENNFDERREVILSKLQNEGITNIKKIKNLAKIFTNGEIEIIEDYANYSFLIKFTSIVGKAPNIENFEKALQIYKPAHLGYEIEFRYNTHGELKQHRLTHNQLKVYSHQQLYDTRVFND